MKTWHLLNLKVEFLHETENQESKPEENHPQGEDFVQKDFRKKPEF